MTWTFETLRPFAVSPARPRRFPAPPPAPNPTDLHLCFGKVGTLPTPTSVGFKICNEHYGEVERKVNLERIEQTLPDGTKNPDNYVDVERAYQIKFNTSHNVPSFHTTISSTVAAALSDFDAEMAADFAPFHDDEDSECNLAVDLKNGPTAA